VQDFSRRSVLWSGFFIAAVVLVYDADIEDAQVHPAQKRPECRIVLKNVDVGING
jgi:hypothetical protein